MSASAAHAEPPLDLVCLGEAMVEFNQSRDDATQWRSGFGGDTSNCAIAAARIGARSGYITQLGDDVFGQQLLNLWRDERVDTRGVRVAPGGGHRRVLRDPRSARPCLHLPPRRQRREPDGAGDPDFAPCLQQVERARTLHVSGISQAISDSARATVFAAIERARQHGVQVSYDLNFRPRLWSVETARPVVERTVAACDIFLPSVDEVALLAGTRTPEQVLAWAHGLGAPTVLLKLGAEGCWVSQRGGALTKLPPHRVSPVDATGAGDCFAGCLLARLAAGDDLVDAARAANVAAALSTLGVGAVAPLPTWPQVQAAMAAPTLMRVADID